MHDSTISSNGGLQLLYIGIWFNLALILHMVEVAFHAPGTCIQLVDLPNRTTLYSMVIGEIQVDSRLCRVFIMCISQWYNQESQQRICRFVLEQFVLKSLQSRVDYNLTYKYVARHIYNQGAICTLKKMLHSFIIKIMPQSEVKK